MATVSANVSTDTRNRFYKLFYSAKSQNPKTDGETFIRSLLDSYEEGRISA